MEKSFGQILVKIFYLCVFLHVGAAFGFHSIAQQAGSQLSEHLPKIVPRLYRYRFDPTPKIQNSMSSIWHALVPETQKTVSKFINKIIMKLTCLHINIIILGGKISI